MSTRVMPLAQREAAEASALQRVSGLVGAVNRAGGDTLSRSFLWLLPGMNGSRWDTGGGLQLQGGRTER